MEWLIIVAIFLAALLPVAWVLPSKRQRYESRQRLYARTLGFQVRLHAVPMVDPRPEDLIDGAGRPRDTTRTLACYALPARQDAGSASQRWHVSRSFDVRTTPNATPELPLDFHWREHLVAKNNELVQQIAATILMLPPGVVALERNQHQLAAFWNEVGDEAGINQLHRALTHNGL